MKIPEFSVTRKVTTAMLAMILVVFGGLAFTRLGLDFFPDIEFPTVSVITIYSGASSEDMENTVTRPLEQVINSVNRVKKVNSISSEGASVIMIEFEWGTNLDFAAQDVRDQIGLYQSFLPEEVQNPLVVKFNLSQFPILFGGITADMPTVELKELIENEVAPRLERIDGVASAQVFSTDVREIRVDIDKAALESYSLSLDRIIMALRMENVNVPAGHLVERYSDYLVRTLGEFESVEDIQNTIVGTTRTGVPIFLKDVADVVDGLKETRYLSRIQKTQGIIYFINKRSGANTVTTAEAVNRELDRLKEILPASVQFFPWMDQASMIKQVIRRTGNNALVGGILAVFFIFVFLRNWRPTATIALAIPLSVITTFIALYAAGYTINMLTLGGLALGIGMLVDNSVVVIENIFRHIEEGKDRNTAAKLGASEVGMAITASTLTTIAVFFPMMFATGITGKMTKALALSIAFSLLASLFVALTVVPLVASLIFKEGGNSGLKKPGKVRFEKARIFYQKVLHGALKRRGRVLLGTLGMLVLSFALIPLIGTEFMPSMDREMIILSIKMPVGTSLEETNRVVTMVEEIFSKEPMVSSISAQIGSQGEENPSDMAGGFSTTDSNEAIIWAGLVEQGERKISDQEVMERIRAKLPKLNNVKFEVIDMSQAMMGGSPTAIDIKIFGREIATLKEIADSVVARIRDVEGLRDVGHTHEEAKPEYHIQIDREKASRMGLMVSQIANTIQTASLGTVATRYRVGNEEIDVRVRFKKESRDSMSDIQGIPIMTPMNRAVYLDQVADITQAEGPIRITRENQARVISVQANISGRDLGSVVRDIKARTAGIEKALPQGYFLEFGGQYEDMIDAMKIMIGAFLLATLLVYMIMASQFESFRYPLIIMFTIPLGIIGIIVALLVSGKPVSLPAMIGFVMLAGIAVNNGIVMVDYINQLKRRGVEKRKAILEGCSVRLRPVLITALTTIMGMLPMALSMSAGSELRAPMAITVIGGLAATTFLTLFIIPIMYSYFDRVSFRKSAETQE
jgi:HAE1 family hydrophobic/amphiphilic exporter-1